jgi:hypothetical protein
MIVKNTEEETVTTYFKVDPSPSYWSKGHK